MKRSSKKSVLAMLSMLLFSSLLVSMFVVTPSKAVDYTKVGVKVGDWAYYSANTNLTTAPPVFNMNFTVTKIDGSNVTGTINLYYTNGTLLMSQTQWGNLSSWDWGTQGPGRLAFPWFLIVPGLAKGDPVFSGAPGGINDTGTMVAGGMARVYDHGNMSVAEGSQDFRWDQATGIGIQVHIFGWTGSNHFYLNWLLISTSLWSPPIYKVGVKIGDWAHYSYYQNTTGYTGFTNANLTITNIDRGNVTANFVIYNSTKQNASTIYGNVSSGIGSAFPFPWLLIAANLAKNDPIWLNSFAWINDTTTMVTGGLARVLDHTNATTFGADLYWDKVTGIGVGLNVLYSNTHIQWNLISTSLWSPPSYKVGVKVGDWAFFSVKSNQTGMETATSANFTVVAINRFNVTIRLTVYSASGPILVQTNWGNLSDGTGTPGQPPIYWWLIASNLVKYDPLNIGSSLWVNETVGMTIFGLSRECNHLQANTAYLGGPVPGSMDLYWDKATGMTVKADIVLHVFSVVWRIQWNMTSTSLWSPAPTIDQPTDITYTFGTTGHSITWHPSSNVPSYETITRNGTIVTSASWNGQAITCNVDGLAAGTYVYTCTVNDTIDRHASSSVTVTVSAAPPTGEIPTAVLLAVAVIVVVGVIVMLRKRKS